MLKQLIPGITLLLTILLYSCAPIRINCNAQFTPEIVYIGFDSTDFISFTLEKYSKCCAFDSLIQTDTLSYTTLDPFWRHDTAMVSNFYQNLQYYANGRFNWIIRLDANTMIKISNCLYEANTCESDNQENQRCKCNLISYEVSTSGCAFTDHNGKVYIYK